MPLARLMSPCWLSHSNPTGSSLAKLKVMVAVWPAPSSDLSLVMVSVGDKVSMVRLASAAALVLPARSLPTSASMCTANASATLASARTTRL